MGVVRERKAVCESAKDAPSNPESVANSGYNTGQESEDEEQERSRGEHRNGLRLLRGVNLRGLEYKRPLKVHNGKRKLKRYWNTQVLETLDEDDETDNLLENKKSKFQILMEQTDDAIECLNAYDDQNSCTSCSGRSQDARAHNNPYLRVPRKIRAVIVGRRNFRYDQLKDIEAELLFLCDSCSMVNYLDTPSTYYERILIHAVAKFNGFYSETIVTDEGVKYMLVESMYETPEPHEKMLCDYIEEVRLRKEENKENRVS